MWELSREIFLRVKIWYSLLEIDKFFDEQKKIFYQFYMLVSLDIMLGLGETENLDFVVATFQENFLMRLQNYC